MHPYESLPESNFWRTGVVTPGPDQMQDLWKPEINLSQSSKIISAGSCFAQHIGRALTKRGWTYIAAADCIDPAKLPNELKGETSSFNTGNIYTASALLQWLKWATGRQEIPSVFWESDSGYIDPFRPQVSFRTFDRHEAMADSRKLTLEGIINAVTQADVFIFTLGLTERWLDAEGWEYSNCPGVSGGSFNPKVHKFNNATYDQTRENLKQALAILREINPGIQIIFTVSPVPLAATASSDHVLPATIFSKSLLRTIAGEFQKSYPYVEYFPSFEIITAAPFRGTAYADNMRDVTHTGVERVMSYFFSAFDNAAPAPETTRNYTLEFDSGTSISGQSNSSPSPSDANTSYCEEEMLEAFAPKTPNALAIIGNSHLAALKKGYDRNVDNGLQYSDEVVFFGSGTPEHWSHGLRFEDGLITPITDDLKKEFILTSGGQALINTRKYHKIAILPLF